MKNSHSTPMHRILFYAVIPLVITLTACIADQHRVVSMPRTAFLEPYGPTQNHIYAQVLNTSQFKNLDMDSALRNSLVKRGYIIVSDPEQADFILQVNMRFADRETDRVTGLGTVAGGAAGAGAADVLHNPSTGQRATGIIAGAIIGSLAEYLAGDQTYTMRIDYKLTQIEYGKKLPPHEDTISASAEGSRFHSMQDVYQDLRDRTVSAISGLFTRINNKE